MLQVMRMSEKLTNINKRIKVPLFITLHLPASFFTSV
jgi:hypothetical protein